MKAKPLTILTLMAGFCIVMLMLDAWAVQPSAKDKPKIETRQDFGTLIKRPKEGWRLKSDRGEEWLLALPTVKRPDSKVPSKIEKLDPEIEKACKKNLNKFVMVVSRKGFFQIGDLKSLLVISIHPAATFSGTIPIKDIPALNKKPPKKSP